jgi:hypothetical protein
LFNIWENLVPNSIAPLRKGGERTQDAPRNKTIPEPGLIRVRHGGLFISAGYAISPLRGFHPLAFRYSGSPKAQLFRRLLAGWRRTCEPGIFIRPGGR